MSLPSTQHNNTIYLCRAISKMKSLLSYHCSFLSLDSAPQWSYFYSSQIGVTEIFQKSVKIFYLNAFLCICLAIFQTALPHHTVQTELKYGPNPATLTCLYNSSNCLITETESLLLPTTSILLDSLCCSCPQSLPQILFNPVAP